MRRLIAATITAAVLVGATVVASSPSDAPVESYVVQPGDNFYRVADQIAPDAGIIRHLCDEFKVEHEGVNRDNVAQWRANQAGL